MDIVNKIHVSKANINHKNNKGKVEKPVIAIETFRGLHTLAYEVDLIDDEGVVVGTFKYEPDPKKSGGVQVWFETQLDLKWKNNYEKVQD